MSRVPFSQVLKNAKIDIRREYDRLYKLFYAQVGPNGTIYGTSLRGFCSECFSDLPFRGTCISLDDFDDFHEYRFKEKPENFDLDYLVRFCEYSYNLISCSIPYNYEMPPSLLGTRSHFYLCQIELVIEKIGYMANTQDGITDFVPKDQVAISVAETIDPNLSYKVIEYNHHSMKGDLERKKEILLALADKLEPQRDNLKHINASLESDIFFLLNNLNVRHNNKDVGKKQNPVVAAMSEEAIEQWYDDTYQTLLLAFLELDHVDRKARIKQLKANPKG